MGGIGWAAAWSGCCSDHGQRHREVRRMGGWPLGGAALHDGSLLSPRRPPAYSGVFSSASDCIRPCRPSLHILIIWDLLLSRAGPLPSCGKSLVSRPVRQDRPRLTHGVVGSSSSPARCRVTELVLRTVLQDESMEASSSRRLSLSARGSPVMGNAGPFC